jgi:hypothetical protein
MKGRPPFGDLPFVRSPHRAENDEPLDWQGSATGRLVGGTTCTARTFGLSVQAGLDSSGFFCSFGKRDLLAAFKEEPHKREEQRQFKQR